MKIGLNNSFWGVFGSPKPPVAWERALGTYLVVGACCVGFKWHFSVKMARWSTPRVPFWGTRGVFWGAREVLDLDLDSFIKRAKRASSEWRSGRYLHLELPKPCELRGRI